MKEEQDTREGFRITRLLEKLPNGPGIIAVLWAFDVSLYIIDNIIFPGDTHFAVSSILYLAGTPVLAAFVASSVLQSRQRMLSLVTGMLIVDVAIQIIWLSAAFITKGSSSASDGAHYTALLVYIIFWTILVWYLFKHTNTKIRRLCALSALVATYMLSISLIGMDAMFWRLSAQASPLFETTSAERSDEESPPPDIQADRLWEAQPSLTERASTAFEPSRADKTGIYVIAVAAQGTQKLFSREAHAALQSFSSGFGGAYRGGVLLSNGAADLYTSPLATRRQLIAVTQALSKKMNSSKDIAVFYLTAHGSREAELATDLPDYSSIQAISASELAQALKKSGIRRKVVIISACYSGSWIPPLRNDDTILIAAAAADRTSFGCSDEREMTFFGEAFLKGPLRQGVSLRQAFESAKTKIAKWEKAGQLTPSNPQVYVGKNMREIWSATRSDIALASTL